jgi:UDP-2,3-diacylglucosamine pyrophosphatase LpxH
MHIDFPQPKTPYEQLEENVIVAGDTSNGLEGLKFLQKLKNKGFNVYACDGNHEHYRNISQKRDVHETTARFREEHSRYHEDLDVPIVLCNGWYLVHDEPLWQGYMNDSRMCGISATDANTLAIRDSDFVRNILVEWRDTQRKGIVVTHTSPCQETLDKRFENHYSNEWYWNPLMRALLGEFNEQILVWCHGHTHSASEAVVDGVRVVCNPRGYPGENPNWKPLTIEVSY